MWYVQNDYRLSSKKGKFVKKASQSCVVEGTAAGQRAKEVVILRTTVDVRNLTSVKRNSIQRLLFMD